MEFNPRVIWGANIPRDAPIDGTNERCIEVPLAREVMDLTQPGRVLDAGCSLNGYLCDEMQATVFHLTQNIFSEAAFEHKARPLSYVSADLRDLSFFSGAAFDRTVCVSTLEHVGMDNTGYGGASEACPETMPRAMKELCRVTRSELLVTVPFSDPPMHCTQWRFFGPVHIRHLAFVAENFGFRVETRYYGKTHGGWYGGETAPVDAIHDCFPQSVNAIACLRCTQ